MNTVRAGFHQRTRELRMTTWLKGQGPLLSVPLPSSRGVLISGKSVVIRQMQGQATNMNHDQARLGYPG